MRETPSEQNLKGLTSDVTSFVIINIFISKYDLMTYFFLSNYNILQNIYFVINYHCGFQAMNS